MTMKTETLDTWANVGSKATLIGGGTIGFGWLTAELAISIAGFLVMLVGLLVNSHYKRKAARRHADEAAKREIRHAARLEMQLAVAKQAMELREEARQQKREEWAARMAYLKAHGHPPVDPPPTDWAGLEELQFPDDHEQDHAEREKEEDRDGD